MAARFIRIETFHTTVGAILPAEQDLFEDALYSLAARRGKLDLSSFNDPRLPENIYATAIGRGALEYMHYDEDD